jgi:hypothetical protein
MIPACLGLEYTSRFDSSMMNGIRIIEHWGAFFDQPDKVRLGLMSASYLLGSSHWYPGSMRSMAIILGSVIMTIGSIPQGAAQHCELVLQVHLNRIELLIAGTLT